MRRNQKKMAEDFIRTLFEAHDEIKKLIKKGSLNAAMDLMGQCQDGIIKVGTLIEESEGEGFVTVGLIEEYCELLFHIYEEVGKQETAGGKATFDKAYKALNRKLIQVQNSVKNDIEIRLEAVFLPYKASMWDSLESVWQAADNDPACDAYVIPIPYYDRKQDGSFGREHYEGDRYPAYVPVTHYGEYDFDARRPDIVFIHNPYDEYNAVTSVHPFYYSHNLKRFTDELVYIPYYSTAGGMSDGQRKLSAYYHADHIIIQAEKYRKFFDPELPEEKLVVLGSPKFDRVIHTCANPPEPPGHWKEKMTGRKVYFYNTSIGGMLSDTKAFLRKMKYVFECFEGRDDSCLLWRPHPLLESTFESMRPEEKPEYDQLKRRFIDDGSGIYDDTPDITDSIAWSDAYIGDAGTSVTSLFGIAGKPMFLLDNYIDSKPTEDDWRGDAIRKFYAYGTDKYLVAQGNKLYYSPENDYHYEYCCDLSEYAYGEYYYGAIEIDGKAYIWPVSGQDIVVIHHGQIEKRIRLDRQVEQRGAFYGGIACGQYLFLIPNNYPAIVRYDTKTDRVRYFTENIDVFVSMAAGERRMGGYCVQDGWLFIASPVDSRVLALHSESGAMQVMTTRIDNGCGCIAMGSDGTDLWMLPYAGTAITRWDPNTGAAREYTDMPEGFSCVSLPQGYECMEQPFSRMAFSGENVYFSPQWSNMYVKLNRHTGEAEEWRPPFEVPETMKNGYHVSGGRSVFLKKADEGSRDEYLLLSYFDRRLYRIDLASEAWTEIDIRFCEEDLQAHEPGFAENSDWLQYACQENAFNALTDFLDGSITGGQFDKAGQIRAFEKIAANNDGSSGAKIYEFACRSL